MNKFKNRKIEIALLLCASFMLFMFTGCAGKQGTANDGPTSTVTVTGSALDTNMKSFTVDELKKFDGQNGNKAYVAIDGVVYDVTDNPKWANGQHNGLSAGNDLTNAISASPHGKAILGKLTIVGKLK